MNARKYEFRSEYALHFIAQGQSTLIIKLLASRFGPLDSDIEMRIQGASLAELETIGKRLLTADSLQDVLITVL